MERSGAGLSLRLFVAATVLAISVPAVATQATPTRETYIVIQTAPALALYQGGVAGLDPTSPESLGQLSLDPESAASLAYLAHLAQQRADLLLRLSTVLGRQVRPQSEYSYAINGFATGLTAAEAEAVRAQPGVAFVQRDDILHTLTDSGPQWMDADEIWDGSAVAGAPSKGERIVAGIIDTGVRTDHPAFAGVGPVDGHVFQNPRGRFYGECAATPPPLPGSKCNNKLIGLYDFTSSEAGVEDDVGHGSHTASTVAGNVVDATIHAPTTTIGPKRISGVAPHANVISYKACRAANFTVPVIGTNLGACPIHALLAAIDQATADVVDVINFSIGGGAVNPWEDPLGLSFFGARAAGVFVAASAGNAGPNPSTMGRPANSPWLMAVGASTHDRRPTGRLIASDGAGDSIEFVGMSLTSGVGPLPLIDARTVGNELCETFSGGQAAAIAGRIVICTQGVIGRVQKSVNVRDAGGAGMVLITQRGGKNSVLSDTHFVPAVHIGEIDGAALREWLSGAQGPQATIEGVTLESDPALADRMAYFSSRGPDYTMMDVIKPDVTAPGVAITAAYHAHPGPAGEAPYNMIQGTSMSGPHAAGAGALIRALHRDWTPDQIKSALMSTAFSLPSGGKETVPVTKEDHSTPADPFDMGAGRIDVASAARAGFTLNESVAGYQAANPVLGGQAASLNLASLADSDCQTSCSWTRTIVSSASRPVTYDVIVSSGAGFSLDVSPATFTLEPLQGPTVAPGLPDPSLPGVQALTVTATNTGLTPLKWQFGELRFVPRAEGVATQHFPVAVRLDGPAPAAECDIPEAIVSSAPASALVTPYNDVLEVGVSGLYASFGADPLPNLKLRMRVSELGVGGALPPNQFWRIIFDPPAAPADTRFFVQMWTGSDGRPSFTHGTITDGFSVAGPTEAGSYDLDTNDIHWTIAAHKLLDPEVGQQLSGISGSSGPAQPGLLTLGLKSTPPGSYTLRSCDDPDPDPTPTPPPGGSCTVPETVVLSSGAALNAPPYNDVREVAVGGLSLASGVRTIDFRMNVTELGVGSSLPPNQHWRVAFVPPGAPANTSYFVSMFTDTFGEPEFVYGTLIPGEFSVLGEPDAGSYDLAESNIRWSLAAAKALDPQSGDQLTAISGASGAAQPGLITTNLKTVSDGTYTLGSCDPQDPDPTPTPTSTPTPTPLADLLVADMTATSQKPREGELVLISATISNAGEAEAPASQTDFRLSDGTLLGLVETAAIAAGEQLTVEVGWDTRGFKGEEVISATADAADEVAESDEGNNLGALTLTIRGNKVQNSSFEQPNSNGDGPEHWEGQSTAAGSTGWSEGGSDGERAVTITGTGSSVVLHGAPSWTSSPISVSAGELLTLTADVHSAGLSSAPSIGLAYLGPAGELLSTVSLLSAPLTGEGFVSLEETLTVPAGVVELRIVLYGFSATDLKTKGTVTFDNIGLYAE